MIIPENIYTTILVFVSSFAVVYLFIRSNRKGQSDRRCPPCLMSVPILGSMLFLPHFTKMHHYFTKNEKRLGPVVAFKLAGTYAVILNGRDTIHEAFVKKSSDFADKAAFYTDTLFNTTRSGILRARYDAKFRKYHQLSLSILKEFGFGSGIMEERIQKQVKELIGIFESWKSEARDPSDAMTCSVMNVICSILFGRPFHHVDPKTKELTTVVRRSFREFTDLIILNFFPFLKHLPRFKRAVSSHLKSVEEIYELMEEKIAHCTSEDETENNFIRCFIKAEKEVNPVYDRVQLIETLKDFFLAGTETTSSSLEWALVILANHPGIQNRLQTDIDSVVDRNNLPSLRDRPNLPYVEAALMEMMRYKTLVPLGTFHSTLRDTDVAGFFIPANTIILPNIHSVHMNPDIWPEPEVYRPERFLDDSGSIIKKDLLIPFLIGKRSCLGEMLARQELFLFVTGLLQRFHIRPPEGQEKIECYELKDVTLKPSKFKVRLVPRS